MYSSFNNIKSGGEIPRRSVDQGFSASPKSNINIALIFYGYYNTFIPKSQWIGEKFSISHKIQG